jgi:hypothetical protein
MKGSSIWAKSLDTKKRVVEIVRMTLETKTESLRPYLSEAIPAGMRTRLEQRLDMKSRLPISVWLSCRLRAERGCSIPALENPTESRKLMSATKLTPEKVEREKLDILNHLPSKREFLNAVASRSSLI